MRSWEDPFVDETALNIQHNHRVLLFSGGLENVFHMVLNDPIEIVAVGTEAQSQCLASKMSIFRSGDFSSLWSSQSSSTPSGNKWIQDLGIQHFFFKSDLKSQKDRWNRYAYITRFCLYVVRRIGGWKWFGVTQAQIQMIHNDNRSIDEYVWTSLNGVFLNTHMSENYFYKFIFTGKYTEQNCPLYLKQHNFERIRDRLERITNVNDTILNVLRNDTLLFDRVVLMDYLDSCDEDTVTQILTLLAQHLGSNGLGIFRSVSLSPWYIRCFKENGLDVFCNSNHKDGMMDYVNIHASFWTFQKTKLF